MSDSLTTLTAGALILAVFAGNAAATIGPPAGYTQMAEDQTGGIAPFNSSFLIAGAAGGYTAEFTSTSGNAYSVQTAAFKAAAAPSGPRPGSLLLMGVGR